MSIRKLFAVGYSSAISSIFHFFTLRFSFSSEFSGKTRLWSKSAKSVWKRDAGEVLKVDWKRQSFKYLITLEQFKTTTRPWNCTGKDVRTARRAFNIQGWVKALSDVLAENLNSSIRWRLNGKCQILCQRVVLRRTDDRPGLSDCYCRRQRSAVVSLQELLFRFRFWFGWISLGRAVPGQKRKKW